MSVAVAPGSARPVPHSPESVEMPPPIVTNGAVVSSTVTVSVAVPVFPSPSVAE